MFEPKSLQRVTEKGSRGFFLQNSIDLEILWPQESPLLAIKKNVVLRHFHMTSLSSYMHLLYCLGLLR